MSQLEKKYIRDLVYTKKQRKKYKKVELLLKDWYGDDQGKQEVASYLPKPAHIKETLDKVLSNALGPQEYKLIDLKKAWKNLMGDQVGRVSEPVSIKNKILTIEVQNGVWLMELKNFHKSLVGKKVKSFCGNDFCNIISFVPTGKS